jgi:hypothetical protein
MQVAIDGIPTRLKVHLRFQETFMSFFDSPIARCEAVRQMVLTDETQAQCAREHDCSPGFKCPLCGYFTETSGISEDSEAALDAAHTPGH